MVKIYDSNKFLVPNLEGDYKLSLLGQLINTEADVFPSPGVAEYEARGWE